MVYTLMVLDTACGGLGLRGTTGRKEVLGGGLNKGKVASWTFLGSVETSMQGVCL